MFGKNLFDDFLVNDISITTTNTFTIDGHLSNADGLIPFKDVKNICNTILNGHIPTRLKMVLSLNKEQVAKLVQSGNIDIDIEQIEGLYFNIKYENNILSCVTGTSLKIFTLDKSLEKYFDNYSEGFIQRICQ
jgi:hypothetical protein